MNPLGSHSLLSLILGRNAEDLLLSAAEWFMVDVTGSQAELR